MTKAQSLQMQAPETFTLSKRLTPMDAPSIFRGWQRKGGVASMSDLICDCGVTTYAGCVESKCTEIATALFTVLLIYSLIPLAAG